MPELVPQDTSRALNPMQSKRLARDQRRAEIEIVRHGLQQWVQTQKDEIDTLATRQAITTALEEEIDLFDYGMTLVNGSETKQQLLARKLELFSQLNNRRITRRFGR